MTPRDDENHKRCWTLIVQAAGKLRDYGFHLVGNRMEKITVAQERVLQAVMQHSPHGVMLKDVAKQVNLSPGAVSQLIEGLVQEKLVERIGDPHDRRAVNIHITEKCKRIRNNVVSHFDTVMEGILRDRTREECALFIDIMEQVVAKFPGTNESIRKFAGETLLAMEEYR